MDNAAAHEVDGIRQAFESHGTELIHLSPYPPARTGQLTARFRALLRKARTVSTLWVATGRLLASFEPDGCANCFRHAGYG